MESKLNGKLINTNILNSLKIGYIVLFCKKRLLLTEHTKKRYFDKHDSALNYANKVKSKRNMKMVLIWNCDKQMNEHIL